MGGSGGEDGCGCGWSFAENPVDTQGVELWQKEDSGKPSFFEQSGRTGPPGEQPGYSGPVAHQDWGAMRLKERRARKERMWLGWMSLIGDIQPQAWGAAGGIGKS